MMGNLNFGVKKKKIDKQERKRKQLQKISKDTQCKVRRYSCLGGFLRVAFQFDNFGATEVKHKLI